MHVVTHNAASLDGRIDGFEPDVGLYYELASAWDVDAHLVGADTLLEGEGMADGGTEPDGGEPDDTSDRESPGDGDPPLLVVTDSRGRISGWDAVLAHGFWSDALVLCSEATPEEHLVHLSERGVSYLVVGDERVDLRAALDELAERSIETVLVDSGGTLSGVLLRAGLVDEVSVLVHPAVVGGTAARSFVRGPEPEDGPTRLELQSVERPDDEVVWLRYAVVG